MLTSATGRQAGAAGSGARHSAAVGAALNDGYARALELAAALTLASFLASFVVPAIRNRQASSGDTGDQASQQHAARQDVSTAGAADATHR